VLNESKGCLVDCYKANMDDTTIRCKYTQNLWFGSTERSGLYNRSVLFINI
jgi:hypothetical protein